MPPKKRERKGEYERESGREEERKIKRQRDTTAGKHIFERLQEQTKRLTYMNGFKGNIIALFVAL